jgi:chromosome segregation ATPase
MRIDFERLERMRRGEKLARSTSLGLSYQIIEVERSRTRAVGRVDEVKMRAQALGGSPMMRPGETEADAADRRNAEANARAEQRARLRQTLRGHPEALGEALQQLETVNADDFAVALAEAEAELARVDTEINELRAEQGKHGNKAGSLKQSIEAAELWLAQHPEVLREDVPDEAEAA